ncbi:protein MTSS 1-like isoform X2 [Liolophura sinensis]|uniref:protein MTSS 1-like isoform X2 n=1 Tax=Liolophura sinensis TaxID=3198878 RepID=UPI003158277A
MDGNIEKDCTALGALFNHIVNDLRSSSPVWEDFTVKATKLHTTLRTTLVAISSFLEAFQKVADMATNTRGATKDIGLALTRLCLRHRSIESKLKSFTSSITDNMVSPIQEKLEDWKKAVVQIDKDHNKECKKARAEIKKAASDTVRLQKKVKKGSSKDMQSKLDHALHDVHGKFRELEEAEKSAVRKALIEERSRFCLFVTALRPFVENEINLLTEVTHLQEIMDSLVKNSSNPERLPQASEQVLLDLKGTDISTWSLQDNIKHSPPSSPSSMGSRKSSMCSISSLNSSSSGSSKSHSPSHHFRPRSVSQGNNAEAGSTGESTPTDSTPSTPSEQANTPSASSTWNNWPEQPKMGSSQDSSRPHTISTAYERSHARPALSATLFEPPVPEVPEKEGSAVLRHPPPSLGARPESSTSHYARPATINKLQSVMPSLGPKPKSKAVPPPVVPMMETDELPVYVNMNELASMEAEKRQHEGKDGGETDSNAQTPVTPQDQGGLTTPQSAGPTQSPSDLDIQEAIRDLENCTAALHSDYEEPVELSSAPKPPKGPNQVLPPQKLQNSLELAEAIRELEASTAALTTAYDQPDGSNASRGSLQCSSGYGTMNSTPSGSEDTITTGELLVTPVDIMLPDREKYFTIPRNSEFLRAYKATLEARRPASTAGIPVTQVGIGSLKRNAKPPPPVRRSSSITGGPPPVLQKTRRSPPKGPPANARIVLDGQHSMLHRRSHSSGSEQAHEALVKMKHTKSADMLDGHSHYATPEVGGQVIAPSAEVNAPPSPQYAVPHVTGAEPPVSQAQPISGIVQSLNAKFAALQQTQVQQQQQPIQQLPPQQAKQQTPQQQQQRQPPQTRPKPQHQVQNPKAQPAVSAEEHGHAYGQTYGQSQNHSSVYAEVHTERVPLHPHPEAEEDFPDLPPPPSEEELAEMNAQFGKKPMDVVRDSLVTELKHGPQLRRTGTLEKTETYQI